VHDAPRAEAGARLRAFSVHVLTASGVAFDFAAVALLCAPLPDPRLVFLLLMAPVVIDAVDGPLARRWSVERWAARIQGRTLDDIVDYLTFTFVPLLLVWRMGWLPWPAAAYVVAACMTSLFGFANADAKQEEQGFFLGFPSYWNVFAFYAGLWATRYGPALVAAGCLALCALTVLPVRFLYPNRAPRPWRTPLLIGAFLWLALLAAMLPSYPHTGGWTVLASLLYPAFYVGLSLVLDFRGRR
jgi:phosphatidylcholine synthase